MDRTRARSRFRGYPIQHVSPTNGFFPQGGTLIFVGVYEPPGEWIAAARPQRTIVVYNMLLPHAPQLRPLLETFRSIDDLDAFWLSPQTADGGLYRTLVARGALYGSWADSVLGRLSGACA